MTNYCKKGERKAHYRKGYRRSDGTWVKGTKVKSCKVGWMQSVDSEMEKRGTVGVFTRAKLAAGYPNTKAGTVKFANAVLAGKIRGKSSEKWKDRARLAKVFVKIADKRNRK
jgi:hypothetical protein